QKGDQRSRSANLGSLPEARLPNFLLGNFKFLVLAVFKHCISSALRPRGRHSHAAQSGQALSVYLWLTRIPVLLPPPPEGWDFRQVESLCRLQQQASGCSSTDPQPQFSAESVSLHEAPHGAFHLAAGDPFQEPQTVLWLGVLSLGFTLVLDTHENLLLAERTLRLLARLLLDHLRLLTPGTNFLLRADRIEGILTRFLPHGQLLFLNDQFVQDLEKEFSAAWPR
uniref:Adaptor related protein complex 5 subunit sigma 1 n=1 Tax=Rattus norvegicus TaxID=10116 RepID=A0A0G2K3F6_RAT